MKIVGLDALRAAFDRKRILQAVRAALVDHAAGRVQSPPPGQLQFPGAGDCHVKFGWRTGAPTFGVKIASGFYQNPARGLPVNSGVVLVFDAATGHPNILFLDEGWLTAWRTVAAVTLVATELAPTGARRIGVMGAGLQASLALEWLRAEKPEWEQFIWARDSAKGQLLAASAGASQLLDPEALVGMVDIVITVTPATIPLFGAASGMPNQLFVAAGTDGDDKQELTPALFDRADRIVVDDREQARNHGDWGNALRAGLSGDREPKLLGAVLSDGRLQFPGGLTIVDLTGIAAQDLAIASLFAQLMSPPTDEGLPDAGRERSGTPGPIQAAPIEPLTRRDDWSYRSFLAPSVVDNASPQL